MPDDFASGQLPVIDVAPLRSSRDTAETAEEIRHACQVYGFFYIIGHGVPEALCEKLEELSRQFFSQEEELKRRIAMARGGRAWRGYFAVGEELTRGLPDQKEGLYFGSELDDQHPAVRAGVPLHGPNLFPDLPGFRETVLAYLQQMTDLGHLLMQGIALSLGLAENYFAERYTGDPLILFRIFRYPPLPAEAVSSEAAKEPLWSVGEHTDYGLLTILRQDRVGGLQVRSPQGWMDAPPLPGSFICNLGDMLDRMTGGLYRSTPHRVRNVGGENRLSFPFFFDPNFDAQVGPIDPDRIPRDDRATRWDGANVHDWNGTYGHYLLKKVGDVFPDLRKRALDDD